MSSSRYKNNYSQKSNFWDEDFDDHFEIDNDDDRDNDRDDADDSYEFYSSAQEQYKFDIENGKVIAVFENENNQLKQERIDYDESYILQGQSVLKIEQERNGQEITRYSDVDGDGWYTEGVESRYQSVQNQTPVSQTSVSGPPKVNALDETTGQVYRLYKAAFDRTPDREGLQYWISRSDSGLDLDDMASAFIASSEFESMYGKQLNTNQFLNNLYLNVLDREADSSGLQWWQNTMSSNPEFSRSKVLVEFSESAENKPAVASELEALQVFDISLVGVVEG